MRRGFTMIETLLSTVVVGVMMVAAVRVVATARVMQFHTASRAQAGLLAEGLLAEITSKPYEDPSSPIFGRETGESGNNRDSLDDVDDYHGWDEKPLREADGSNMSGMSEWGCKFTVERVNPSAVTGPASLIETGAKRVTVTLTFRNRTVLSAVAIRTRAR